MSLRTLETALVALEKGTRLESVANMASVCFLNRCMLGEVKMDDEIASSKTRSASERMRSSEAGERNDAPVPRRSQLELPNDERLNGLPPNDALFCRSHTLRSASPSAFRSCSFAGSLF